MITRAVATRLRRTLDLLTPVAYWGPDLRLQLCNAAFAELFGVAIDAVIGRHMGEVLWPDFYAPVACHAQRALDSGAPQHFDHTITLPDGAVGLAEVRIMPDVVDGEVLGIVVDVLDMTERRQAQHALALTQAKLAGILAASPVGMATVDAEGHLADVNPALAAMLGHPAAELAGRRLQDFVPAASAAREVAALLSSGSPHVAHVECGLRAGDGTTRTAVISVTPTASPDARELLPMVAVEDVTERRRAEALRRSQERLEQAEQITRTGTWEWNVHEDRIAWSRGLAAMLRISAPGEHSLQDTLLRHVYAADQARLRATLAAVVAQRSRAVEEFRIVRGDGRVRSIRGVAEVVVDEHGEPARVIAVLRDITDDAPRDAPTTATRLPAAPAAPGGPQLSERQLEVLGLVAQGLTTAQIAHRMYLSPATVKWHVKQILAKTNAANRTEAVARVFGERRARQ